MANENIKLITGILRDFIQDMEQEYTGNTVIDELKGITRIIEVLNDADKI